jgi:hypothetical protein
MASTQEQAMDDGGIQAVPTTTETKSAELSRGDEKKTVQDVDIEVIAEAEPVKYYYSKLSVWLMVAFSGLAIGSDG